MLRHTLVYFFMRAVNGAIGLAALYFLTRLLTPADYGLYALGISSVNVAASVAFQWLIVSVARFYPAHLDSTDALLNRAHRLFLAMAGVVVAGGLLWMGMNMGGPVPGSLVAIIAGSAVAMGLHNLHLQIMNARGEPLRWGLMTSIRAAGALTLAALAIEAGLGAGGALVGLGLACLLSVLLFGARWNWRTQQSTTRTVGSRALAVYGLPLAMTYVSTMVIDVSDRFMLAYWHGTAGVASYAAAYDLTQQSVGVVMNVFFLTGYPRITAAWEQQGVEGARKAMRPMAKSLLLATPVVVGIFVGMAPQIAQVMFGAQTGTGASELIPWITCAIAIGCIRAYFFDIAFHLKKSPQTLLWITGSMACINVGLNLVLIPAWGTQGAAISTLVAAIVGTVASWQFGRKADVYPQSGAEILKSLAALAIAVLAFRMAAPTNTTPVDILLQISAGLTALVATVLVFNLCNLRHDLSVRTHSHFRGLRS